MPQPNQVVDMWTYLEEWNRCISSRYQRDSLYRTGRFDTCSEFVKDLKIAFRAKRAKTPEEAEALLATTRYRRTLGSDPANSPTAGFIWDLKERPGWEVEE